MRNLQKLRAQFYSPHTSIKELHATCESVCRPRFPIYGAYYTVGAPIAKSLRALAASTICDVTVSNKSPYLITVNPDKGEDSFNAFLYEDENGLACLLALGKDYTQIRRLIYKLLYPELSAVYLRTNQLFNGLLRIVTNDSTVKLLVKDHITYSFEENAELGSVSTHRHWFPESPKLYSEVFDKFKDEHRSIKAIGLRIERREYVGVTSKVSVSHARVKRHGTFICESGFSNFLRTLGFELSKIISKNITMFKNRSFSESNTHASKPLSIKFNRNIFDDKKQHLRIIGVLRALSDSSLSVYHPNPYLHASLMDYLDASSYSIWITEHNSILIVPERKASVASLERLCNHICERFEEGEIKGEREDGG